MANVKARINQIKQPRGGYINPRTLTAEQFYDGVTLSRDENLHPSVTGMAVEYMTRFLTGTPVKEAFPISLRGLAFKETFTGVSSSEKDLVNHIRGLDRDSIAAASRLVTNDVWLRNPAYAFGTDMASAKDPDAATTENIRVMVQRGLTFWDKYGPIVSAGFDFQPNGYTQTVDCGDGDFLTADTLWDFKVSGKTPTNKNTLQILMYWIMGRHSGNSVFDGVSRIGIFNPRLNTAFTLDMDRVPRETILAVERDVICY